MATAVNPAQAIALAMRDFVNTRTPDESQVEPFMQKIGGYATLFGLVVAISDSLHLQLVRRVLARLFEATPAGRARLCSEEVGAYLLAGLQDDQLKHVKLLALQQTHLFILDEQGQEKLVSGQENSNSGCCASRGSDVTDCAAVVRLCLYSAQLHPSVFDRLLVLLECDDVDLTEEATVLLRALGATPKGLEGLLAPATLRALFKGIIDGAPEQRPEVIEDTAQGVDMLKPFMGVLRAAGTRGAPEVNSVIMLRVLTLLTHIACGTPLPAAAASNVAAPAASAGAAAAVVTDPSATLALRQRGWDLFESRGLFALLLQLASIAPPTADGPAPDMLVQLNALELLEEIVAACPRLDDAFASQLTAQLVEPALGAIEAGARAGHAQAGEGNPPLIPTASFVAVGVLRVFQKLASVSGKAATGLHGWYRQRGFLLFLSAAAQAYDDESVQTEAINLLCALASFPEGLAFFSAFTSSLPSATAATPAAPAASPSPSPSTPAQRHAGAGFAAEVTPILLHQVPYFVYGSSYSNGLRQLAALHGLAEVIQVQHPAAPAAGASAVAAESKGAAAAPVAESSLISVPPTELQRRLLMQLPRYHNGGKGPLDLLLLIARQPFEDLREAVFKLLLSIARHAWGVRLIAGTGGFIEYLLDRKTEFHVSGMRAKYDVIRALDASPFAADSLLPPARAQLHEYVRQGAHYAPLTVGVMAPVSNFK